MWLPINYDEPLFRPPSEANSLIIQLTKGCSHNKCAFCEMYTSKEFSIKSDDQIKEQIDIAYKYLGETVRKVFLADANALVIGFDKLKETIEYLRSKFPKIRRISAYALPSDLSRIGLDKLKMLNEYGLDIVYVGIESGNDKVLRMINKSESLESTKDGISLAHQAGIKTSVMIINGLGGRALSNEHAIDSARLISELQPFYLSSLVLSFPFGLDHFKSRISQPFEMPNQIELFKELYLFIDNLELKSTIFRSDHASNYLPLKGVLGKDKVSILTKLKSAIEMPNQSNLRAEWARGL